MGTTLSAAGDEAFLGMMDSGTTVASLKEKLQETTGIKVGWQVLLLGANIGPTQTKTVGGVFLMVWEKTCWCCLLLVWLK